MLDEHVFSIVCMVCGFCFLSRSSWFVLLHVFLLFLACPLLLSFKRLLQSQWCHEKSPAKSPCQDKVISPPLGSTKNKGSFTSGVQPTWSVISGIS